jgi:uncharacterized alkaline shock family protein YloU
MRPGLTHSVTSALRSTIGIAQPTHQATEGVTVDRGGSAPLIKIRFVAYHDHSALAVAEAVQRGVLAAINQHTGIIPTVSVVVTDVEPQSLPRPLESRRELSIGFEPRAAPGA